MENKIQELEKEIENWEVELEISKKERTKSRIKSIGFNYLLPALATAGATAGVDLIAPLINLGMDSLGFAKIADYVGSHLPLITGRGLENAVSSLIGATAMVPFFKRLDFTDKGIYHEKEAKNYSKKVKDLRENIHWVDTQIENEGFRIKREEEAGPWPLITSYPDEETAIAAREKLRRKNKGTKPRYFFDPQDETSNSYTFPEIATMQGNSNNELPPGFKVKSEYGQTRFQNTNAYDMFARAADSKYLAANPSASALNQEELRKLPDWGETFFELARSSKEDYDSLIREKVITEDTAGDVLRQTHLSQGIID